MALLEVQDLHVYYDAIHAIKGISFEVQEGEIVTLIGANGAGKTTTLHTISGLLKPRSGFVTFANTNIVSIKPHKIIRLGLAQVPEGRRVFSRLTVKENLVMGAYVRNNQQEIDKDYAHVLELLPRLKERLKQTAGTLSGGEQQMLAIGRALMARPKMLLLDEPSMGLSPLLVQEIFSIIRDVNQKTGTTVLLVEQNAKMALEIASRAYVMETGRIVMSGEASKLADTPEVKRAYLGG
ncbi:MAG: ABC transporter ATP-binding protein [Oscillospiraceae bacterium]